MARSKEQIQDALKSSITNIDNRLDLKVGVLWDYLLAPVPPQLATIENKIDNLKRYYSPNFASVASPTEARDFAINFGTGPSIGNFAKTTVVYFRNSPPSLGRNYTVPIGSLVMTQDHNLVFRTTQTITMSGDYAATYFNPSTQKYEISVGVEAVAPGEMYNIPKGHINRMQPQITGLDGVLQVADAKDGTEPEDSLTVARRIQEKFKGLDRNSIGGITTRIKGFSPTQVGAVSIVKPTDRMEFRRLTGGPAIDVYVQGIDQTQFTEDYLALGGEIKIPIQNRTANGIVTLTVNGAILDSSQWVFVADTSLEFQGSTRANPVIQLITPLDANDLVEIVGVKNALIDSIQNIYMGDDTLFKTDVLIRSFIDLPIIVSIEIRINDGDPDDVRSQVYGMLIDFIQPLGTEIPSILIPDSITNLLRTLPEVDSVKILEFRRKVGSINVVETIVPYKNQIPILDITASNITVRL